MKLPRLLRRAGAQAVRRWRALRRLQPPERADLALAVALLPSTALATRLFGLKRTQRWMKRLAGTSTGSVWNGDPVRLAELVDIAGRRGVWTPNCLQRSLVLWWLLRRRGVEAEVRLGVRQGDRGMEAHAWVELDGMVLNDRNDVARDYAPFEGPAIDVMWI